MHHQTDTAGFGWVREHCQSCRSLLSPSKRHPGLISQRERSKCKQTLRDTVLEKFTEIDKRVMLGTERKRGGVSTPERTKTTMERCQLCGGPARNGETRRLTSMEHNVRLDLHSLSHVDCGALIVLPRVTPTLPRLWQASSIDEFFFLK